MATISAVQLLAMLPVAIVGAESDEDYRARVIGDMRTRATEKAKARRNTKDVEVIEARTREIDRARARRADRIARGLEKMRETAAKQRIILAPDRKQRRDSAREKRYGLRPGDVEGLLWIQGGCCATCKSTSPKGEWHVDHDHDLNIVRGILCHACNNCLGFARDNIATLRNMIEYLGGGI